MELVNSFSKRQTLSSFSNNRLELIALLTKQYGFSRVYCYEDSPPLSA